MKIIKNVVVLAVTLMVAIPLVTVIALKIIHYVPTEKVKGEGFVLSYPDKTYHAGDTLRVTVKGLLPDSHSYGVYLMKDGKTVDQGGAYLPSGEMRGKVADVPFYDVAKGTYTVKVQGEGVTVKTKKIVFK
jgi:hypothetical protein